MRKAGAILGSCLVAVVGIFAVDAALFGKPPLAPATQVVCEIPFDEPIAIEDGMTIYYHGGDSLTFIRADGSKHTIYGLECKATIKEKK